MDSCTVSCVGKGGHGCAIDALMGLGLDLQGFRKASKQSWDQLGLCCLVFPNQGEVLGQIFISEDDGNWDVFKHVYGLSY